MNGPFAGIYIVCQVKISSRCNCSSFVSSRYLLLFLDGIGDLVLDKAECSVSRHARHLFVIQTGSRDLLSSFLKEHGIGTLIHYPCPPFKQNAYKSRFLDKSYPKAELVASSVLSLPIGIHINEESIEYISDKIIQFFGASQ